MLYDYNGGRDRNLLQGLGLWTADCVQSWMDCIKAFSETDFTEDLRNFDVPTLIIHGDDDQNVPIEASARLSAKLVAGVVLKIYPGGSHSLGDTSKDQLNSDLLAFLRS